MVRHRTQNTLATGTKSLLHTWETVSSLYSVGAQWYAKLTVSRVGKGTSRQRSGKDAIRKRFPLQKPRWEKTKVTIRYFIP